MLTPEEKEQFIRQIPILEEKGQEILKGSKVLVAGAGGLGTTIALHCAFAGFGTIRIADCDTIERSNLNRQTLYRPKDIGKIKALVAEDRIRGITPYLKTEAVNAVITEENAMQLTDGMDVIIDAMDNYDTRYILADAAEDCGIPFIHGAIDGFYGQVATIVPGCSACLRCIVPHPPPREKVPALSATTGVIGSIQVTEAIKCILGKGTLLTDRILMWDGLQGETALIHVSPLKDCPHCGSQGRG
ncbi:HesA/MoeB/ThiF family protein [Methanogenium organophilum]|uniref:HesA/MoeB/ThiF family protein n=1 Tax=Methanogenium organophilum TaxID=2199 RepID=A0A9X9S556_METOG|nr:HesA/MoeB/ThiF family protein [Methanogenium organophilum]WAI01687.1 HesA/MoeB/ThiF family protein [Methanogenium organophilum]